jgi:hypothetical protein
MPLEIKLLIERHECPNLKKIIKITAEQRSQYGKTWIATFDCDHYESCPTVRLSENSFNFEPCPLHAIFKRRGNL